MTAQLQYVKLSLIYLPLYLFADMNSLSAWHEQQQRSQLRNLGLALKVGTPEVADSVWL